jgi:tRNA (cytidine/uridine-2'-O-)-methyltransferase
MLALLALQKFQSMNIVLFEPEIPQNTGNIGRTCVALNAKLWIVRPTGFRLDDKQLQRAGLDYWQHLNWEAVDSWDALVPRMSLDRMWLFTKFAKRTYTDVAYQADDWLVFGSESRGLPESLRERFKQQCVSLPMIGPVRSLNLSVAVGVGVFEAFRQTNETRKTTSA